MLAELWNGYLNLVDTLPPIFVGIVFIFFAITLLYVVIEHKATIFGHGLLTALLFLFGVAVVVVVLFVYFGNPFG